jgi:hydrogenase maturation protein HypF
MHRQRVRRAVRVEGVVQGVGFRPFCHALADRLGLAGFVGNDTAGVFAEVEGAPDAVAEFVAAVRNRPPPLALVERVQVRDLAPTGASGFVIAASVAGAAHQALVAPDTATCPACLAEIFDPADRRHRYPFTNCTNCGPRLTIVVDVPYDRPRTTMARFPMCADCAREYHDPADRRFHAQPVCCPACGPRLRLSDGDGTPLPGDPLAGAATLLSDGRVLAVKGLGGYHLAATALDETAVAALRSRKHRYDKPFAVMVADLAAARELCAVDDAAAELLTGSRRPIVLVAATGRRLAAAVAPGNRELGLLLPYTPVHHLLLAELAAPLVLTSGNVSDEPIAFRDDEARERLRPIADAFLDHDRGIHTRVDDSVVRVFRGAGYPIRRARGYAPEPVPLGAPAARPILGCGAELKNTFCLAKGTRAFLSQHVGDLENAETFRAYVEGIAHYRRLFDVPVEVVAHDLHPEYLSTKYALGLDGVDLVGVQHHHAHVAACLADNDWQGPVVGVAFDGLGYGTDGTLWGGEFLLADRRGFRRVGYLDPVPMPGGAAAVREPWRMAAAYLAAAYPDGAPAGLPVRARNGQRWPAVTGLIRSGLNAPLTSSVGRLFDAVAALLDVRDRITYEGQAAIELEQLADPAESGGYPVPLSAGEPFVVSGPALARAVVEDRAAGPATVAARFHRSLARVVVAGCERARERHGTETVALSGGVFQNVRLLSESVDGLTGRGFRVLTHRRVPANDGGVSLGQVAVAAARTAGR